MLKRLCVFLFLFSVATVYAADTPWYRSRKQTFTFEGREAFLIVPDRPLDGNPWIWRAHFPDWHTSMDSILVAKGYHVAYINTNDMYGSPRAMNIWDRFYSYLVNERHLASKVVLEGVSRGGLYVHNWAKRNPTRVACLYAESPVCDLRTWPKEGYDAEWDPAAGAVVSDYIFYTETPTGDDSYRHYNNLCAVKYDGTDRRRVVVARKPRANRKKQFTVVPAF